LKKIFDNRKLERDIDFVGATVPNVYVFGNGMDYCEYYRNVNGVYAIKKI
ncbi:MAG: hypoxanthine-guanine phosphoribosyltransferase, partial [Legionellales bacterium]|nr:hypoxanthine-guanine phosphoribosyltransferase [Legionellales bacterium]